MFDPVNNFACDGLAGYERLFPVQNPAAKVRLEATPTYIYQSTALSELPDLETRPKFIFILREPSRQILSTYRYFSNNWDYLKADVPFADFIAMAATEDERLANNELLQHAFRNVRYAERLEPWRARIGVERMRVLLLEDLQARRDETMGEIAQWLDLDPTFYETYDFPRENETYQVRSQMLQSVNIRVRGLLAKTPLYEGLRQAYRKLNTKAAPAMLSDADEMAMQQIKLVCAPQNAKLASRFDLDLTPWGPETAACR